MKNIIRKTLLACAVTTAMGVSASASAAVYQDFDVNTVVGNNKYAFTADKIIGNYAEIIDLSGAPGTFSVSLVWTAGNFVQNDGVNSLPSGVTGLNKDYGIYAIYNASGTVSTVGTLTTFTFAPGSGKLDVWYDKDNNAVFGVKTDKTGFTSTGTTGDYVLASGDALSGQGTLNSALPTCGTADGINCGSFGSRTTFDLTEAGKSFFVSPSPFYPLSFQSGQLNSFELAGRQVITGSLDVVFNVPEPTSVALLGLGLVGLGLSRRRNKKA